MDIDVKRRLEAAVLAAAMGLPERVQRLLGGRAVEVDGCRLAPDTQLMLRLQRLARETAVETLPVPQGRVALIRQAGLVAGRQPIGSVEHFCVGSRRGRLFTPTSPLEGPLLLFFHGGGFMYGGLESHDAACRVLAERSGVPVLAVDYRLAPEDPFPAAYDDALASYRWVVDHAEMLGIDVSRLAVGGDSAGGNLAAGVALHAAAEGLPLAYQLLIYPMTDAEHEGESAKLFGSGFYLTTDFIELANQSYLPLGTDLRDPRLSPLHADLPDGIAPAYIATAGFDPLRDEGEAYAARLAAAGVDVRLRRFEDQIHGFLNVVGVGRSSRAAVGEIADVLAEVLG